MLARLRLFQCDGRELPALAAGIERHRAIRAHAAWCRSCSGVLVKFLAFGFVHVLQVHGAGNRARVVFTSGD